MITNSEFLIFHYNRAKQAFQKCILDEENAFLQDEIESGLDQIILVEEFLRIQFNKNQLEKFTVEVKFQLTSSSQVSIGEYYYCLNEDDIEEDRLIFI